MKGSPKMMRSTGMGRKKIVRIRATERILMTRSSFWILILNVSPPRESNLTL